MIGLNVKKNNEPDNFLYIFFQGINFENYNWKINYEEILFEGVGKFFDNSVINGKKFLEGISRKKYYMIFTDINAYKIGGNIIDVETYNDYLISDCEMIFLCSDSQYIDFYCKNNEVLYVILQNCIKNNFNVSIITEENNTRIKMSVP